MTLTPVPTGSLIPSGAVFLGPDGLFAFSTRAGETCRESGRLFVPTQPPPLVSEEPARTENE